MISTIKMMFKSICTYISDTRAKHSNVPFSLPYVYLPCSDSIEFNLNDGWQRTETNGVKGIINKIEYSMAA